MIFTTTEICNYCHEEHYYIYDNDLTTPEPKHCPTCGRAVTICSICVNAYNSKCNDNNKRKCKKIFKN